MSDLFYNLMEKVKTGVKTGFSGLFFTVGILSGGIGWLGGIGVLLFQAGYWLLEGKSISIAINDVIPTPQYFYMFKGLQKIIDWIFELPLFFGLWGFFGCVCMLFFFWLAEKIDENI